jgi:MFS family permease
LQSHPEFSTSTAAPSTKWWILAFSSVAIFGNYYVYDAVGPLANQLSTELGFSDTQIGSLNAIYHFPNMFLVLIGGLLVDKFGAGRVALITALVCFAGTAINASSGNYAFMLSGRFLFGIGAETMLVALTVCLGIWFGRHVVALAMALNLSLGRLGSYSADLSPLWAGRLYEQGWQSPMILAAALAGISVIGAIGLWWLDRTRNAEQMSASAKIPEAERFRWTDVFRFDRSFWYVAALCVLFYSVIFPFRSTFAIKYFQHAHDQSLEQAALLNSYVFLAAVFLTPLFGWTADRFGRRGWQMMIGSLLLPLSFAGLLSEEWGLWLTTVLLGVSYSLIPAIMWPSVVKLVAERQLGTAYGLLFMIQAIGLTLANLAAGALNDAFGAGADNPAGYTPMLIFFAMLASCALVFAVALWRRESGPHGHGLEAAR